jgi:beta-lactam-binding protein with PASTA domain
MNRGVRAGAALTALMICWGALTGCTSDEDGEGTVPDVVGLSQGDAWDALQEAGFDPVAVPVFVKGQTDPAVDHGHVFEQEPVAGAEVTAGSDVEFRVRATPGPVGAEL